MLVAAWAKGHVKASSKTNDDEAREMIDLIVAGDSGGGLVLKVGRKWFVRGIVSASLRDGASCDVNSFAVFTDIAKFTPWIKSQM